MVDNPHKRPRAQKLADILHVGGVTQRGLVKIIDEIRKNPEVINLASRWCLNAANLAEFMSVRHVEPLTLKDGSVFNWEMGDPNRMLQNLVDNSPHLQALYLRAAAKHPCSAERPWSIVFGFDEFCPGNKLKVRNERKNMVLSYSFVELGQETLWHAHAWTTPVCVRSSVIAKVQGGWSHMFRQYLRLHIAGVTGITSAGVPLMLRGRPFLLFAKFRFLIGDGDALRAAWDWKGANGMKPCFRHSNVVSKGSGLTQFDGSVVDITCSNHALFQTATAAHVADAVDVVLEAARRVSTGRMTKTKFDQLQKVCGLNASPDGVLADIELRQYFDAVKVTVVDWLHSALQDGTINVEAFLLVSACEELGLTTMTDLEAYFKYSWHFPAAFRAKGRSLYQVFDACRCPAQDRIKCTATEMLGVYGLLRHFVQTRLGNSNEIAAQRSSFEAACKTMDIIKAAKHQDIAMEQAASLLKPAIDDHMRKHLAVYGTDYIKPKHHWMYDVAEQFETHPFVLDCFIIERLHLRVKASAEAVHDTTTFERSVLASVMTSQRKHLHEICDFTGLLGRTAPFPGCDALVADALEHKGLRISFGDIVLHAGGAAGQVIACVLEDEALLLVVEVMQFASTVSPHSAKWRCTKLQQTWDVESVQLALAWYAEGQLVVVLRA
jgi:hypothetical protein